MEHRRSSGYTSIHERRLELIERSMLGPRRGGPTLVPVDDDELVEIDSVAGFIAGLVGTAIQGVSAMFPLLLAAFVAPIWFLVVQYAAWAAGMRLAIRWREHHPWLTLAIPIVSIGAWVFAVQVGTGQLGWPPLRF